MTPARGARGLVLLFASTLFLSAFLLFSVEPMFGKMVLPLFGGTPAVWNTCLVVFQVTLLAGYGYAHLATAWLGPRKQALLHAALLLVTLLALPIRISPGWVPPVEANPILPLLGMMLVAVGLPFFTVSTSAPLLQKWFALTDHPDATDPYNLYVASNVGSLLALLSYPFFIEPHLRLREQSWWWVAGYGSLLILLGACTIVLWRSPKALTISPGRSASGEPLTWSRRFRWLILAGVPSSLMLGVTTYLSTDIAAIPLLWVIPLALYLLTFIVVFARRPPISHRAMVWLLPVVMLVMTIAFLAQAIQPVWLLIALHLLVFFVAAMVCHGELAKDRPPTHFLTEFYLWMSLGGVVGGLFNALVAPLIFETAVEYPLAMVLACLLRPPIEGQTLRSNWLDYAMPLAMAFCMTGLYLGVPASGVQPILVQRLLLWGLPTLICYSFRHRPIRFGLSIGAVIFAGMFFTERWDRIIHIERSFFGIYRVVREEGGGYVFHRLAHGTTTHGMQNMHPAHRREPLTYFYPTGPIGQVFKASTGALAKRRVAVIGLGTGSLACYATPAQEWTFYEIDPTVQGIATNPRYFTFLRDCLERVTVILGDARRSLLKAPDQAYDLIIVDAFSSDAIPVHLLTREAVALYLTKLSDHGLLVLHTSNRYLNLLPVVGTLAEANHLVALARRNMQLTQQEQNSGKTPSEWVALARTMEDFGFLASRWYPIKPPAGARVWTDDFSNILSVFRWK